MQSALARISAVNRALAGTAFRKSGCPSVSHRIVDLAWRPLMVRVVRATTAHVALAGAMPAMCCQHQGTADI
jgi:hypothetical protein